MDAEEKATKALMELYAARLKDRAQSRTRRRKKIEGRIQGLGDLIEIRFQKDPQASKKIEENRVLQAWAEIVGPTAGRLTEALRIRGDELIVRVEDGLWMQQLMLAKHDILHRYRLRFPKLTLRNIFFVRRGS